ncbi:MAG TPA: UDP-N-acetylmuramoyl-L-alanyl-D-glutamate--2,6-diaminopimelate ligase [Gammaproteobacteria bacterium]|nr:UDP-N-acetylmuramoyl-L-alanyl-D-glutamate--2,6-diaminopimelate ligase [Gammaproteobacteria bacterium]
MMAALATRGRTLGDLLGSAAGGYTRLAITDLTLDSRQAGPGAAFVAVPGQREHGLSFARQALERGAAIVLYEPSPTLAAPPEPCLAVPNLKARLGELARAFYATAGLPTLLGVTGTNGKTTVAYLLAQVLSQPQRPCGYVGTLGYGVPPSLTAHGLTTPDTLTLHRELAELGAPRVAMEVSSHALNQDRVAGLTFHTAIFTNLTRDHLDEHGDLASYGDAKRRLFKIPGLKVAVLNADDPFAATIAADLAQGCTVLRTSMRSSSVELWARLKRADLTGVELDVAGAFGTARLTSKLIGAFNAENLLSALGALVAQGMALPAACVALGAAHPAPGRMEVLGGPPSKPWVVVDYAHTPDALFRVLTTLEAAFVGELWCVFGCGGDRDRGKRPLMGAVVADLADRIVLTDDNPRSEDPAAIIGDIREGIGDHPRVNVVHDRRAALKTAIERARPGDVVLVAGKGHETEQLVGTERRAFSDRAVVAELLGVPP